MAPSPPLPVDAARAYTLVLRDSVKRNLQKADSGLAHLHRLLSTPTGVDRLLSLMYYLSTLLSPLLSRLALRLTIKLPTPVPLIVLTPASSVLTTAAYRLRLLAARVSDVRTFLRLLGLVGMYNWGASTLRNPPADPMVRGLMLAQVAVNCCFQALENAAYLNKHGILAFAKRTESHMALWSTRCWAAHIVLEFVRLERVRSLARDKKGTDEEKAAARRAWLKAWVRNAASAPLSLHGSLEEGLLSDMAVGALGTVSDVIGLRDAWNAC